MPDKTYKMIEIVGTSSKSVSDAVISGIEKAAKTLRHMSWFEVSDMRGRIDGGKVEQYQVTLKIGMRLED